VASITDDLRDGSDVDIGESVAVAAFSLARHFAGGATLWCISPQWPEHARHIAVEFVHPVLVGKRALPAVCVDVSDPVAALRSLVRPGDVVLAVSRGDSATTLDVMRRAEAWGAMTIWMGAGPRPNGRSADHIVWADDDADPDAGGTTASPAVHDGRLVLLYHVLWELTHVCFEHPGLLSSCESDEGEVCITCSDEGRIGEVIAADGAHSARVRTARGITQVDTTMVEVVPGDLVLIHAGAAITVVP
jgi:hypothetical protein